MEISGLAIAAHELKAPLTLMRQLSLVILEEEDTEARAELCRDLVGVSERALKQVQDLARMENLTYELFPLEPVSVRAVCDEVAEELAELFAGNNRRLVTRYQNRSKLVVANWQLLRSVVQNFCLNAMQYGEVEQASELKVREWRGRVMVEVRDFGPALPLAVWRKLQEEALSEPVRMSLRPGSSGLGLLIASRFAKFMGARVRAVRHRDGASFMVELPVSRQGAMF